MVTSLKKINSSVADTVDQAVFLRDAPRPTTCEQMSERLRLSRALKWITDYRFDQIQHSDCGAPVGPDPISQVLTELRMEHSSPFTSPARIDRQPHVHFRDVHLDAERRQRLHVLRQASGAWIEIRIAVELEVHFEADAVARHATVHENRHHG